MTLEISEEVAQRILDEIQEQGRLENLSDEDLVREYLRERGAEDDLIGEEMANRLWPNWEQAETL